MPKLRFIHKVSDLIAELEPFKDEYVEILQQNRRLKRSGEMFPLGRIAIMGVLKYPRDPRNLVYIVVDRENGLLDPELFPGIDIDDGIRLEEKGQP